MNKYILQKTKLSRLTVLKKQTGNMKEKNVQKIFVNGIFLSVWN